MLRAVLIVLVIVVLSATGLYFLGQRSLPSLDGIVSFPELSRGGVVKFDDRGVPYIEAATDLDLYRIQGYITAQDRLMQMDMLRRKANGELSEVFGSQSLPSDKLMRTIGIGRTVKEELKTLPRELRTVLDSYAQGVNTYIATNSDRLPLEFGLLGYRPKPWRAEDTLAIIKYSQYQVDESWRLDELRQNILDKVGDKVAGKIFERVFEAPPAVNAEGSRSGKGLPAVGAAADSSPSPSAPGAANAPAADAAHAASAGAAASTTSSAGTTASSSAGTSASSSAAAPTNSHSGASTISHSSTAAPSPSPRSAAATTGVAGSAARAAARNAAPVVRRRAPVAAPSTAPAAEPQFAPEIPRTPDTPQQDDGISPNRGSNGWIVSSSMSDSKGALLAIDKHNAFTAPVDWHMVSMRSPDMHIAGATIPGVPGVMCGRSEKIGWGIVALKADVQDLYLEQFSSQMPGQYKIPTGWANATELVEEIPVRFSGTLFATSNLVHKVIVTRHGPLLTRNQDSGVAISWVGTHALGHPDKSSGLLEAVYQFNHASNFQQFQTALQKYAGSPMTCLYGDTTGNIGYQQAGTVPRRANGAKFSYESCLLTPGWTGFGDWVSSIPFGELDHAYNPASGYFVANMPELKADLPVNVNLYRSQRIDGVLSAFKKTNQKTGLPDMALLQSDQLAPLAPVVKGAIAEAVTKTDLIDVFQIRALDTLTKWDGTLAADSPGAAIYESFLRTVARRVLEPKLGGELTTEYLDRYPNWSLFLDRILREKNADYLPPEERTFKNFIITSFVQSLKDLRISEKAEDTSAFKWGDLHRIDFVNVVVDNAPGLKWAAPFLNVTGARTGGDQDTVSTMESSLKRSKEQFACREGATMRLLVDMSDKEKFYQTLALGQSGNLLAGNRSDQLKSFFRADPVPLPVAFSTDAESKISQHRLLFSDK